MPCVAKAGGWQAGREPARHREASAEADGRSGEADGRSEADGPEFRNCERTSLRESRLFG